MSPARPPPSKPLAHNRHQKQILTERNYPWWSIHLKTATYCTISAQSAQRPVPFLTKTRRNMLSKETRSYARTSISLIVVWACVLMVGCLQDVQTIWSAEARSPVGHWLAIAHTIQH